MIRLVEFENWQAYRGIHCIPLEAKIYAVTAVYEENSALSNMGGKSAFFEGIDFAMTGRLSKPRRFDANGWITRGESKGEVKLTFEDGATIRRWRIRGKRTEVELKIGDTTYVQEDAEREILRHFHIDAEDFSTMAYFEQDTMNRLVRTDPATRFDIVRGWLSLQKAEHAEDMMADELKKFAKNIQDKKSEKAISQKHLDEMPKPEGTLAETQAEMERLGDDLQQLDKRKQALYENRNDLEALERYKQYILDGKALAAEIAEVDDDLEERHTEVETMMNAQLAKQDAARKDVETKRKVSLGQFDGKCPVTNGECPVKDTINENRRQTKDAYEESLNILAKEDKKMAPILHGYNKIADDLKEVQQKRGRLDAMRDQAKRLQVKAAEAKARVKAYDELMTLEEIQSSLVDSSNRIHALNQVKGQHKSYEAQHDKLVARIKQIDEEVLAEEKNLAIYAAARTVFRATQRRVSERALAAIVKGANGMIDEASIKLSIEARWEREGTGYAKTCEMCGAAFPTSVKVKECQHCGAARGQTISQKLEFLLSDRSGAADDIAGVGLQLSAGSFVLRSRASSWSTALIDEPMAKVDAGNRRGMALSFLKMAGRTAYRQMFVISHSPEINSMFPGRVQIEVKRGGERVITVS